MVVLREVGEGAEGEAAGADARLVNGVAGDLHDSGAATGGDHRGEIGLQGAGVRRGAVGGGVVARPLFGDGGEKAGEEAALGEHVAQEPGGGGFAVGAGDAAEEEAFGGAAEVLSAGLGESGARVVHTDVTTFTGAHDGGGAFGAGFGDVPCAVVVGAGDGYKKGAGDDPARVARDVCVTRHFSFPGVGVAGAGSARARIGCRLASRHGAQGAAGFRPASFRLRFSVLPDGLWW